MKVNSSVTSDRNYLTSQLFWNKKRTKVSAKEGETRIEFKEFPKELNPNFPNIKYSLGYSGSKLEFLTPYLGVYRAKFVGFISKEGEKPSPKTATRTWDGKSWEEVKATAKFRLIDPAFNGLNVIATLTLESGREFLSEDENGNITISVGKSSKAQGLVEFLDGVGILSMDFPFSTNPLPKWEKAAKKKKQKVDLLFEKGFVSKFLVVDEFATSEEEEDDDAEDEAPWEEDGDDSPPEEDEDEMDAFDD